MSTDGGEFFVGYLPRAPRALAARLRVLVALLLALAAGVAGVLSAKHARRPAARFEYGSPVELAGRLVADPYPQLLVARPGQVDASQAFSSYALVAPFKHGAEELVAGFVGQSVRLRASLIYRDGVVLAELEPGSLRLAEERAPPAPAWETLGTHVLRGEIVDSKCFFGVMNPGELKPHRACAVRCISGGIPPVLCVRDGAGRAGYLLLVDPEGAPVRQAVLDFVAEPVEIRGEVRRAGERLVLFADPRTYRRLE